MYRFHHCWNGKRLGDDAADETTNKKVHVQNIFEKKNEPKQQHILSCIHIYYIICING